MNGRQREATRRETEPLDWGVLGARIGQAAAMAGAIHLAEKARSVRDQQQVPESLVRDSRLDAPTGCRPDDAFE